MIFDDSIFKAYDIRGLYPQQFNEKIAYNLGRAFAVFTKAQKIIVGRDMRESGISLAKQFIQGVLDQGCDVMDVGEISTDCSYFASGKYNLPAVMFTASHNPAAYNGMKFSQAGAVAMSQKTGLFDLKELISKEAWPIVNKAGSLEHKDVLSDYISHCLSFVDYQVINNLKIIVDAGNGMAGKIFPLVQKKIKCEVGQLFFQLDGSFPNHEANPIKPENVAQLIETVKTEKADLGVAFDGDADRVFFIDEQGKRISSSLITALIADAVLDKHPQASIIYNVPCSKIVPETVIKKGGQAFKERVGHSFIKATMRTKGAIFGGEHSGHYYFKNNYFADSGLIACLFILEILCAKKKTFSQLLAEYQKYYGIEETNSEVADKEKKIAELKIKYQDANIEELDGITFNYADYWFNVRPSNTESLLRLNLEAISQELRDQKAEEVLNFIRS